VTIRPKPAAEVAVDEAVIRALLREQHADLSHLALVEIGEGWDNTLYRLGNDLVVRLPRRAASAALIEHEQRWLPELAPRLPLPIPVPVRVGRPGCGFPWSWSITPWIGGESAARVPLIDPADLETAAIDLARFLRALHQPAPSDAPRNPYRGVPLADRAPALHEHLDRLDGLVDREIVLALWAELVDTPPWPGPPVWIHGDLHPDNLLVHDGRLTGVIDFGDLTAGDPATDLSLAWMLFPPAARLCFRDAACGPHGWLDDRTWRRARGWALALGVTYLAHSHDNPILHAIGRTAIDAVVDDPS
jgi:aminoglycoside phosphotransferase (APT) family kinase protein